MRYCVQAMRALVGMGYVFWGGLRFRRVGVVACLVLMGMAGSSCSNTQTWHQKLTIEVETPDGVKTGSSVTEVSKWTEFFVPGMGRPASSSYRGEATVVEVAPGKYLFATIHDDDTMSLAQKTFSDEIGLKSSKFEVWTARLAALRMTKEVNPIHYPGMVTFTDINDPKSVKRADPENFEDVFGYGYRLKSVRLSIVDSREITRYVESVLPWLEEVGRARSTLIPNPPRYLSDIKDELIERLSSRAFSTELYK